MFINFKQSYITVNSRELLKALEELRIRKKFIILIKITLQQTVYRAKMANGTSEKFVVFSELKEIDPMSPNVQPWKNLYAKQKLIDEV